MAFSDINSAATVADVRMALRDALAKKYGRREAEALARLVVMTLKGWTLPQLLADENRQASDFLRGRAGEVLDGLLNDMPVQYALGCASFYGLNLKVGPGVLVPRPETEELVDLIVKENREADLRVLDLCTGSGAIALALARNLPFSRVEGVDISPQALAYARENMQALKTKVEFIEGDVFRLDFDPGSYDIVVANPPYVDESEKQDMEANVLNYEPHSALFVPDDNPLVFYRRITSVAEECLKPGGRIYFEINPRHWEGVVALLEGEGFADVEIINDVHGRKRFAKARKPVAGLYGGTT